MSKTIHLNANKGTVLITGGSGLVGSRLTELLIAKGYAIKHLSTSIRPSRADEPRERADGVLVYGWKPSSNEIDKSALEGVDYIINLAGVSISKRWTSKYKKAIRDSRVDSLRTLYSALEKGDLQVRAMIGSSAVGYYPSSTEHLYSEKDEPDNGFLGAVCQEWEQETKRFEDLGLRVALLRTGIVLSKRGGALPVIAKTVRWFIGAPLGRGNQIMPWIHIDDLCRMYIHVLESDMDGPINAVGVKGATNREITRAIGRAVHRPIWPISVPAFLLKLYLGEQAQLVLMSTPCSNERIATSGFTYNYSNLDEALSAIYRG